MIQYSYHQLQVDHNSQVGELEAMLRVRSVEVERAKVLYEEATQNLLRSESQRDEITKRVEVRHFWFYRKLFISQALNTELLQLHTDTHKKETELEMKVKELTSRVESYEKVENELDQVILQAAEGSMCMNIIAYPD